MKNAFDGCTPPMTFGTAVAQLDSAMEEIYRLRSEIKSLCKHPSMSFHQAALLEGILSPESEFTPHSPPVAMTLPECKVHKDHGLTARDIESDGWNACLDKVEEMNS